MLSHHGSRIRNQPHDQRVEIANRARKIREQVAEAKRRSEPRGDLYTTEYTYLKFDHKLHLALALNKTIQKLTFQSGRIVELDALRYIFPQINERAAHDNQTIQFIILDQTVLLTSQAERAFNELAELFMYSSSNVQSISLKHNHLTNDEAKAFIKLAKTNKKIMHISIDDNPGVSATKNALLQIQLGQNILDKTDEKQKPRFDNVITAFQAQYTALEKFLTFINTSREASKKINFQSCEKSINLLIKQLEQVIASMPRIGIFSSSSDKENARILTDFLTFFKKARMKKHLFQKIAPPQKIAFLAGLIPKEKPSILYQASWSSLFHLQVLRIPLRLSISNETTSAPEQSLRK